MSKFKTRKRRGRGDTYVKLASYGLSLHAPFVRGEDADSRHMRRFLSAVENSDKVAAWCESRGVQFSRFRPHESVPFESWRFRTPDKFAQWLPHLGRFIAKPVLRERTVYTQKVYDWEQLLNALDLWLQGSMS